VEQLTYVCIHSGDLSRYSNPELQKKRIILLHCTSGVRSALAGETLQDMGYAAIFGSFEDPSAAGSYRNRPDSILKFQRGQCPAVMNSLWEVFIVTQFRLCQAGGLARTGRCEGG
jgi:rhodanese-related sulfurtransferase